MNLKKYGPKTLFSLCYAGAAVLWLLLGVLGVLRALTARAQGQYPQTLLAPDELECVGFVNYDDLEWDTPPRAGVENFYLSTDNDPQIHWEQTAYLETVTLYAKHDTAPGSVVLYYKKPGQADYSETQKIFARTAQEGVYTFDLGGRTVSGLRIDPDSVGGVPTVFGGVELNADAAWYRCFVPGGGAWLLLLGLPALLAAALRLLAELPGPGAKTAE